VNSCFDEQLAIFLHNTPAATVFALYLYNIFDIFLSFFQLVPFRETTIGPTNSLLSPWFTCFLGVGRAISQVDWQPYADLQRGRLANESAGNCKYMYCSLKWFIGTYLRLIRSKELTSKSAQILNTSWTFMKRFDFWEEWSIQRHRSLGFSHRSVGSHDPILTSIFFQMGWWKNHWC